MPGRSGKKTIAKIVKSVLNSSMETKHRSVTSGAFDYIGVSGAGTLISLTNQVGQGTADNQRIGNQITLKKLFVSKIMRVVQSTTARNCAVRVLLVQSRGGPLTASDFPNYYSPCDIDKMIVMRDLLFNLGSGGSDYATGNTGPAGTKRLQLKTNKFPYRVLQYDGASGDCAKPIYLYLQAELASVAEQAGYESLYYKDA